MNCLGGINGLNFTRQNPQKVSTRSDAYQKKPPNTNSHYKHEQIATISSPTPYLQSFDSLSGYFGRKIFTAQIPSESQWIELVLRKVEPAPVTACMSTFQPARKPADHSYPEDNRCLTRPGTEQKQALESHIHRRTANCTRTCSLPTIPEEPSPFPEQK
ncbi:hypothetical protein [Endozoicomonas sp. YOMI1]|uniref:hypothetical protein n=1 Tax=Endozoicomonas sp. YOMI1 TaxID=2828739 RepID=UPI00214879D7|nr:hypothetical protein [Endozoicomonas sp. YOMI1]